MSNCLTKNIVLVIGTALVLASGIFRSEGLGEPIAQPAKSFTNSLGMKMVLIPAGEFRMGSSVEEGWVNEQPQHLVKITRAFYIGVTEVTQEQYKVVMGLNPSKFKGKDNPVEMVSWNNAVDFCKKLNEKEGKTYRLPTEAEWEYACRAGSKGKYCFGNDPKVLSDYAWYAGNSSDTTHPVGQKKPNAWGLYDMHGNVWEWCGDRYKPDYYGRPTEDPKGASGEPCMRGGSFCSIPIICRSAYRYFYPAGRWLFSRGFRAMCESGPE